PCCNVCQGFMVILGLTTTNQIVNRELMDTEAQDVRWEPCCNIWQGCEYTKLQVGHQQVFISHSGADRETSFLGRVVEMGPLVRTSLEIPVEGHCKAVSE